MLFLRLFLETLLWCCYFASFGCESANTGANRTATSSWVRSFVTVNAVAAALTSPA